jgi:hypothetical protein
MPRAFLPCNGKRLSVRGRGGCRLELEKLLEEYSSAASMCKDRLTILQEENSKIIAAFT